MKKNESEKVNKRPWWHYILLPIIGIVCFIGAVMFVAILFN